MQPAWGIALVLHSSLALVYLLLFSLCSACHLWSLNGTIQRMLLGTDVRELASREQRCFPQESNDGWSKDEIQWVIFLGCSQYLSSLCALTLVVGWQEWHQKACKKCATYPQEFFTGTVGGRKLRVNRLTHVGEAYGHLNEGGIQVRVFVCVK